MPGRPGGNPRDLHDEGNGPTPRRCTRASEPQQRHEDVDARAKRRKIEAQVDGDSRAVDASCASVDKDRLRQRSTLADQSASCGGPVQALGGRPTTDISPIPRVRGLPSNRTAGVKQATADETVVIPDDEDQMEEAAVGSDGFDVGALAEQQPHRRGLALLRCEHEHRPAILVPGLDVGALAQQQLCRHGLALLRCEHDRGPATLVRGLERERCTAVHGRGIGGAR